MDDQLHVRDLSQTATTNSPTIPELAAHTYEVPESEALHFVQKMKVGWNLGNTFDANSDTNTLANDLEYETLWVKAKTTKAMITALKEAGFRTLRLPVSWHNHVDEQFTINKPWLDRVQEVVDDAYDNDLTIILNIHHDDLENYYYPSSDHLAVSEKFMRALWTQLSERFKSYDHRLVFESINEPRLRGTEYEWRLDLTETRCLDAIDCINVLNQVFVDVVRASGGHNIDRYLMVPGYAASADYALLDRFRLPTDLTHDRLIVSVHAYTPYPFALQSPNDTHSIARWHLDAPSSTQPIDTFMDQLYEAFIRRGVPVIIGEFGARDKGGNLQDRIDYAAYYVNAARSRGMIACWWDNHSFIGNSENFGLMERRTATWTYPDIVQALVRYSPPIKLSL